MYLEQRIYLTGGLLEAQKSVSYYNIAGNRWEDAPDMNEGRHNHSSCVNGDRIFVLGGENNNGSVETYQIDGQSWSLIAAASELTKRFYAAAAALDRNNIIVWGGVQRSEDE